jgi:dihydroflavonol-4-reductase
MRVLVTGATGFIGANVVRAHLKRGDTVRCLVRKTSPSLALDGLGVEKIEGSLSDAGGLVRALQGCDGVQHIAGLFDPSPGGAARMREVHVDGTRRLLEAAAQAGVRRVVLCSSSITVGWGPLDRPGDEDTPIPDADRVFPPGSGLRAYLDTKRESEALAVVAAEQGVEVPIVNPDYVIGPWDLKPTSGALIVAIARRPIPFYPAGGKCFVDAGDCGQGHVLALERGVAGRRYLLGNHNMSYKDFMTLVARIVGSAPPFLPLPGLVVGLASRAGALYAAFGPGGKAGFDPTVITSMQEKRYRNGARARTELGLPCTSVESAVETAWTWFREHGYAPRRSWLKGARRYV